MPALAGASMYPQDETHASSETHCLDADSHHDKHTCNDSCPDCNNCHSSHGHTHANISQAVAGDPLLTIKQRAYYTVPPLAAHQTSPPIKPPSLF